MKVSWPSALSASSHFVLLTLTLLCVIGITTGCGSSGNTPLPKLSGNTSVTVLLSSTANDQVSRFDLQFQTLTLTNQSGKTVTLLSSQQSSEVVHLNGGIEPLATVTVPQDVYTSATVTLAEAVFVCIAQVPGGGLGIANYSILNQPSTVNVQLPITVTGNSMALLLETQVSSSAVFSNCWTSPPFEGFSLTPTFNLAPIALSTSPTNSENGKVSGLKAEVASVGTTGSSLTLTVPGGPYGTKTLTASSNTSTVFQGISGASAITAGMFLDMDGAIQSDGSLLATRIAVENISAVNLLTGPVMLVASQDPIFMHYGRTELGALLTINGQTGYYSDTNNLDFSNATFSVSGQFTNLQNLPFVPSFNGSNMVPGQDVDITPSVIPIYGGQYPPANTITLIPQTINATVVASQPSGSFTDYTVSLASYDLFPQLAVQQGQRTLLTNPSQVEVYIDSSTQKLNTQALAPGSTLRFYGLVFNDNGTLRMDCAQVNDGVSVTPAPSSAAKSLIGRTTSSVRATPKGMVPLIVNQTTSQ